MTEFVSYADESYLKLPQQINTEKYQEFLLMQFIGVHANSRISLVEQKTVRSRIHTFTIMCKYYYLVLLLHVFNFRGNDTISHRSAHFCCSFSDQMRPWSWLDCISLLSGYCVAVAAVLLSVAEVSKFSELFISCTFILLDPLKCAKYRSLVLF